MITDSALSNLVSQVQSRSDSVSLWYEYGDTGNGSFESFIEPQRTEQLQLSTYVGGVDPFFILYTGGTTGESKGALHSHESVWYGMQNQTVAERIVPSDVYMLTGQMFHIPVVLAMNYHAHGCPLVLMNFRSFSGHGTD